MTLPIIFHTDHTAITSTAPSMDPTAWKLPPNDTQLLLTLNVDRGSPRADTWKSSTSIRPGEEWVVPQKVEEEAAATGAPIRDNLQSMAIIPCGLSCGRSYGAGSEATHLRAKSSRATTGLSPCCLEAEQRIMRQVEVVVSSVYTTFDKHIRWFAEQSNLLYTIMPQMIDIVRVAMTAVVPSISLLAATAVGASNARGVSVTDRRNSRRYFFLTEDRRRLLTNQGKKNSVSDVIGRSRNLNYMNPYPPAASPQITDPVHQRDVQPKSKWKEAAETDPTVLTSTHNHATVVASILSRNRRKNS
ncbi:hypothetical protein M9H77_16237 [Catharanthus roseus]|uniref:Uncharacterized protein n=1 Tax=Catharanthus roseus TaxID=4058 RepID=A0ACC0AZQ4_CATRO|nr:hypothetical protein M9H77_16237 [Catharanthus roseus]